MIVTSTGSFSGAVTVNDERTVGIGAASSFGSADRTIDAHGELSRASSIGELMGRFSLSMNEQTYSLFANKAPKKATLWFEASTMPNPVQRTLKALGCNNITVAYHNHCDDTPIRISGQ